jgi:HK97 family phage major capsid protein
MGGNKMKFLVEKRNSLLDELDGLTAKIKSETRAFNEAELGRVDAIKKEIAGIDATLKVDEESRSLEKTIIKNPEVRSAEEIRAEEIEKEERSFVDFLKGDTRALSTAGQNGVTIPLSIANKIVDKVVNLSPVLSKATIYNLTGDLSIPVYDYTVHVPSGYATELAAITATNGTFTSVVLKNNIIVSLATISKSLVNRADVDVVPFIVNEIAKALAHFIEKELVAGAGGAGKLSGLAQVAAGQTFTGGTTLVITPQELVKVQMLVPQIYQKDCVWLMHPNTLAYIQGLTAGSGSQLLLMGNALSGDAPYTLLGKPVYVSDNMPQIGVAAKQIFFGDFSGIAVKMTKSVELQVLTERFADQYAIGVLGSVEMDSNIVEPQKIACYKGL